MGNAIAAFRAQPMAHGHDPPNRAKPIPPMVPKPHPQMIAKFFNFFIFLLFKGLFVTQPPAITGEGLLWPEAVLDAHAEVDVGVVL